MEDQYGRADVAAVKLIRDFKSLNLGKSSEHEKFMEIVQAVQGVGNPLA